MAAPMGAGCMKFGAKAEDSGETVDKPEALKAESSKKGQSSGISNVPGRHRSLMTATVGRGACASKDCSTMKQNECDLNALKQIPQEQKTIVYIFGGPGSKKGCIVENLVVSYGFHLISIEELIMKELPKLNRGSLVAGDQLETNNDASPIDGILKVREILNTCPDRLTLSWLLEILAEEIERRDSDHILVDLLPNFQFLLEASAFAPADSADQMKTFEAKVPSFFAIYLDTKQLDQDKFSSNNNQACKTLTKPSFDSGGLNYSAEIKSEIDAEKMQYRLSTFVQVAKSYLKYFRGRMRLITLDTSRASADHIWFHVNELFETLHFKPKGSINPTVVFATDNNDIMIQPEKSYTILRLLPEDFYSNEQHLLDDLGEETQKVEVSSKPLVVICHVANTLQLDAEHPAQEKCIKYLAKEDELTRLELTLGGPNCDMESEANDFKAISTPGNVVCFFPLLMDDAICRQVAAHVSRIIQKNLNRNCA